MAVKTKRFINLHKSYSCSMPGVWRAAAYCTGVVVIFHSPRACAHVARTMDINSHYRSMADGVNECIPTVPLLSSQLEEKHSIFGGAERLTQCVEFAMRRYRPQCLVIANSCVAGVIGDDVASVVRATERKYGIPVLTVDCCGFLDGEYYQGYFEMAWQMAERFLQPCERLPGTALLLGDNGGPWGPYASEVTRLLGLMGIRVIGQFPGYMAFSELPKAAEAEAVVILGGRGQSNAGLSKIAARMRERLGMPYLDVYPVGWRQTEIWISKAGDLLQRQEAAARLLDSERERLRQGVRRFAKVTEGKKAALCIGRLLMYYDPEATLATIALCMAQALRDEWADMARLIILCQRRLPRSGADYYCGAADEVHELGCEELRLEELLQDAGKMLLLGSSSESSLLYRRHGYNFLNCNIAFPANDEIFLTRQPFAGFNGCRYMLQRLWNAYIGKRLQEAGAR